MSRSGYSDGLDSWELIRWRGAVKSAIEGNKGQKFLKDLVKALEDMPDKKLYRSVLVDGEKCCAMGAVCKSRGLDVTGVDPYNPKVVGDALGIARAMAAEIAYENDEDFSYRETSPEERWERMYNWAKNNLRND